MKDLKCPCCGASIVEKTIGFVCSNQSEDNKCSFIVYHSYYSRLIDETIAMQIIEKGETDEELEFISQKGSPFRAKLKIIDGKVVPLFKDTYLDEVCPKCGGKMKITSKGYVCENHFQSDNPCPVFLASNLCQRPITTDEIKQIIHGESPILDGFVKKDGKQFSAMLMVADDGSLKFMSELCKCPKCGGSIRVMTRSYKCVHKHEDGTFCDFYIARNLNGHDVTPQEVITLCEGKETNEIEFSRLKGGTFRGKLFIQNHAVIIKQ